LARKVKARKCKATHDKARLGKQCKERHGKRIKEDKYMGREGKENKVKARLSK
jgi:hypothetical protein